MSIYTLLASFGGFYALINVSCNSLLNERQSFSLKNSMIKKLYTKMEKKEEKNIPTADL